MCYVGVAVSVDIEVDAVPNNTNNLFDSLSLVNEKKCSSGNESVNPIKEVSKNMGMYITNLNIVIYTHGRFL